MIPDDSQAFKWIFGHILFIFREEITDPFLVPPFCSTNMPKNSINCPTFVRVGSIERFCAQAFDDAYQVCATPGEQFQCAFDLIWGERLPIVDEEGFDHVGILSSLNALKNRVKEISVKVLLHNKFNFIMQPGLAMICDPGCILLRSL